MEFRHDLDLTDCLRIVEMSVSIYPSFSGLPSPYRALLDERRAPSLFLRPEWYENFAQHALPSHVGLRLFAIEDEVGSAPQGLLVGFEHQGPAGRGREIHFTHPDHVQFHPYLRDPASDLAQSLEQIASYLERSGAGYDKIKFAPLAPDSRLFNEINRVFVARGFIVRRYLTLINWHDEVSACSARQYLDQRPSVLKAAGKRRSRRRKSLRLARDAAVQFQLISGGEALQQGIADYVRVTAGSWQGPERLPGPYTVGAIERAAAHGCLRLGLLYAEGRPATAQFWTASNQIATCYRISYDQRFARYSLGSLLTQRMIEHVIDVDRVSTVDFGSGDESYKQRWVSKRRELWGLVAFNPRTMRGLSAMARHALGQLGKRALGRR